MTSKHIEVPLNPTQAKTQTLFAGLRRGFRYAAYEIEAVEELVRRGQRDALTEMYQNDKSLRKLARAAIRHRLNLER
jgi:hypothetical protein